MLQYVFGGAATGKTTEIFRLIDNEINPETLLIVPEQFSFETERELLSHANKNTQVTNFTRLLDTVESIYGKSFGDRLNNYDKIIVMRNILNKLASGLRVYKKYANSLNFCSSLIEMYDHFVMENTDWQTLSAAASKIESSKTKEKIEEILLIFNTYKSYAANNMLDPSDDLNRLYEIVDKNRYFVGKTVYIDAFKDFYGCQLKIIECIIRDAKDVYIAFTYKQDGAQAVFNNLKTVIAQIDRMCEKYSVQIAKPTVLTETHFLTPEVTHLEKNLFCDTYEKFEGESAAFKVIERDFAFEMFFDVFSEISRLVREENYRYRDFVIIARDIKKYEKYMHFTAEKFNIPLFEDRRKALKYSPLAKMIYSAYGAACHLNTEKIFNYLRCGLNIISEEDIDALYNYVYVWSINGKSWLSQWNMNPKGFTESSAYPKEIEETQKTLLHLNEIRRKVMDPLIKLRENKGQTSSDKIKALYEFMCDVNARELCSNICSKLKNSGDILGADFTRQSWDSLVEVFNSVYKYLGNENITDKEFEDIFYAAISCCTVGSVPQMLDEVSCGSADRIRPARPKCVFVVGLNFDEFPMAVNDGGLLLNSEKELLINNGANLVNNYTKMTVNENYLLYTCSCCATDRVYYCRSKQNGSGANLEASPFFLKAKSIFSDCLLNRDGLFGVDTADSAFSVMTAEQSSALSNAIRQNLKDNPIFKEKVERLGSGFEINEFKADKGQVDTVIGDTVYTSPSKVDTFYKCRFSYFCRYILKLEKTRKAEIDNLNRGTLVHYVLEHVIKEHKDDIATVSRDIIDAEVDQKVQNYLDNIGGVEFIINDQISYTVDEISKMCKTVLYRISDEFNYSSFHPEFFEAKMSLKEDADFKSLVINADKRIVLNGFIDRADVWRDMQGEDYIRIIDYKTGKLTVNISDILYGLNLQMLLYLYGIIKNNDQNRSYKPAGVFYYKISDLADEPDKNKEKDTKTSSLFLQNEELYQAFDRSMSQRFVKKMVTPKTKNGQTKEPIIDADQMELLFKHLDRKLTDMGNDIANGDFSVNPVEYSYQKESCDYCDYKSICMHEGTLEKINSYNLVEAMNIIAENNK